MKEIQGEIEMMIPVLSEGVEINILSENEYILSNKEYKHYLKINQEVHDVIQLVDGENNLLTIAKLYSKKHGGNVAPYDLYNLLYQKLGEYGIIKNDKGEVKKSLKPSYILCPFVIINERALNRIVCYFYFLFNKKVAIFVLIFSLLLIVLAFWKKMNVYEAFDVKEYFMFYLLFMCITVTFHEIGHATAASYFGSKPGGIGGGFYLFKPVYYTDVSDIWRLNKMQRIVVNFAGIYFELILNSMMLLFAFLLNNHMLMALVMTALAYTIFNLNPLIRSDGFWIISDLINKPNILQCANKKMTEIFKWIWLKRGMDWKLSDTILVLYGVMSYFCMGMFVYYILFVNFKLIVYFPKNVCLLCRDILNNGLYSFNRIFELFIPLLFYIILYKSIKLFLVDKKWK